MLVIEVFIFWIYFGVCFLYGLDELQFDFASVLLKCFASINDVLMSTISQTLVQFDLVDPPSSF